MTLLAVTLPWHCSDVAVKLTRTLVNAGQLHSNFTAMSRQGHGKVMSNVNLLPLYYTFQKEYVHTYRTGILLVSKNKEQDHYRIVRVIVCRCFAHASLPANACTHLSLPFVLPSFCLTVPSYWWWWILYTISLGPCLSFAAHCSIFYLSTRACAPKQDTWRVETKELPALALKMGAHNSTFNFCKCCTNQDTFVRRP